MIKKDQPTCFPPEVVVGLSSKDDGTILDRLMGVHDGKTVSNRTRFCDSVGINYSDVAYQRIVYGDKRTYNLICEVDDGSTTKYTSEVVADALFTSSEKVGLMLPVADCVATVIYSPETKTLAMLHLGRHSVMASLLNRSLEKFKYQGASLENLLVWMSPNIHKTHYVMDYFDRADDPAWMDFCHKQPDGCHLDLQGKIANDCQSFGVKPENIYQSEINTATSPDYFSHYSGDHFGRFAVVAYLR